MRLGFNSLPAFVFHTITLHIVSSVTYSHHLQILRDVEEGEAGVDTSWYSSLYKAAMYGDWEKGKIIFNKHKEVARRAKIRWDSETALHVAVGCGHILFVRGLLKFSSKEDLEIKRRDGCTALGIAAKVGNLEAAKLLVRQHSKLLYICDENKRFPIHNAAECGQKALLFYLLCETTKQEQYPDPYDPKDSGPDLILLAFKAEFYDIAFHLLERMPNLLRSGFSDYDSLYSLYSSALNASSFSCCINKGLLLQIINACVPSLDKSKLYLNTTREIGLQDRSHFYIHRHLVLGLHSMHRTTWKILERIVPLLSHIRHEKLQKYCAKKLTKRLCKEMTMHSEKTPDAARILNDLLKQAAANGIHLIIREIVFSFPDALGYEDDNLSTVFRIAIKNRHHEVYNLLHEMGDIYVNKVKQSVEYGNNNILHLAGRLAPSDRLRVASSAALQMQRELQWFKEIESLVQPSQKRDRNCKGKTPHEVFTENHSELMEKGEKWMKDMANSCTVAAALIATIVFAAAITVPGGNNGENGKPMLGSEKAFIIFGVADALSLFTSCVSILMFLSIITSRYAEDDFLRALPTKLIIGLLMLFISVASMLAAFSSVLYLMFGHQRRWILGCVIGPSCLIVATFASMQISFLQEMIKSTYGTIFTKRIKRRTMTCSSDPLRRDI